MKWTCPFQHAAHGCVDSLLQEVAVEWLSNENNLLLRAKSLIEGLDFIMHL